MSLKVIKKKKKHTLEKQNNFLFLIDEFLFNEMVQKPTESFFEKKLIEKSRGYPCKTYFQKSHVYLYWKANSQTKKNKYSKNYQKSHSSNSGIIKNIN